MVDRATWQRACEEIEAAHGAILRALHAFEIALVAPAPDGGRWKEHVRGELVHLVDVLEQHAAVAASQTGIIKLIESTQGRSSGVSGLLETHRMLVANGRSLLSGLRTARKPEAAHSPFRRDAARLAGAVREHEARESELIYDTDVRVSGGEG